LASPSLYIARIVSAENTRKHDFFLKMEVQYQPPVRCIHTSSDLEVFKKSESFLEITGFVKACADSVIGKKVSDSYPISENISKIVGFLDRLHDTVGEIPPLKQPMRFGNKAFKIFHSRVCEESFRLVSLSNPTSYLLSLSLSLSLFLSLSLSLS
jgi:hypothetical protein